MPRCEGTSPGVGITRPCPDNRCDESVRCRQGDLMLCDSCTEVRFPTTEAAVGFNLLTKPRSDVNNELLYFVQNKCHILTVDSIASICSEFYSSPEVELARALIAEISGRRLTKHKSGTDREKRERTAVNIIKVCVDPSVTLPVFYSTNMARIPPVGIEHVDVSALVQEIAALRAEVRSFAAARVEIADIRATLGAIGAPTSTGNTVNSTAVSFAGPKSSSAVVLDISSQLSAQPLSAPTNAVQSSGMMSPSTPSFASLAARLQSTGMSEKAGKQPSAPKQKPKPVVGRSVNNSRVKSVVTKRQINMFISRLAPDTNDADVEECVANVMSDKCGGVITCCRLQSKHAELYASYHITVSVNSSDMKEAIELLNNADHWP